MPPSFAGQLAVPILRDFRSASTEVDIDLISPYGVGPPLGDVDVAVVYSQPTLSELISQLFGPEAGRILGPHNMSTPRTCRELRALRPADEMLRAQLSQ